MPLGYVAPILKQGIPTAQLAISEIDKEVEKWKNSILLYVIGEAPTIAYLTLYLQKSCGVNGKFEVFYHNEGYFVIRFENLVDQEKMLFEGPYMIACRPVIVKEWMVDFCFEKEVLHEVPLWVKLPNLPLTCWSSDSLSRISSVLGKPICVDECTTQHKRISYARLLVEVDITQPLTYKVQIEDEQGRMIEHQVLYEWVPVYCQKCHRVGHVCKERKPDNRLHPQMKQWLVKEKGKDVVNEEDKDGWNIPQKIVTTSIQVGNIEVPTGNKFQNLVGEKGNVMGGDLFPFVIT